MTDQTTNSASGKRGFVVRWRESNPKCPKDPRPISAHKTLDRAADVIRRASAQFAWEVARADGQDLTAAEQERVSQILYPALHDA